MKKQLSFDIDTNVAKKILGEQRYTQIYADIRNVMRANGWEHIEGSVYMSKNEIDNIDVTFLIKNLKKEFPYITKCVREMHQADISEVHSRNEQFEYDGTPGKFAKEQQQSVRRSSSVLQKLAQKKEMVAQRESRQQPKQQHKQNTYGKDAR
ncbi:MAG: hypothetical protein NC409_04030 [Clostridium sp.]|nr:hypothetical protein [Clostridium sp.]